MPTVIPSETWVPFQGSRYLLRCDDGWTVVEHRGKHWRDTMTHPIDDWDTVTEAAQTEYDTLNEAFWRAVYAEFGKSGEAC